MINDLVSNFVLTQTFAQSSLNNASANSNPIDMSQGMTGSFLFMVNTGGIGIITLTLEYSADGSTWVADDGSTGNMIVNADGSEIIGGLLSGTDIFAIGVVNNPVGTSKYARLVATESGGVTSNFTCVGAVGKKRFSEPL